MPVLKKGSKQAKDYMAKIRAMKGTKKVAVKKTNTKKVGDVYYYGDGKMVSYARLIEGEFYEWIIGAEYQEVQYIGRKLKNKDLPISSKFGTGGYIFQFDDGRYADLSPIAVSQYLRTIPKNVSGYTKGSSKFIEYNEKPIKGKTNYRVTRNDTTLLTKGGTFKKFNKISNINTMEKINGIDVKRKELEYGAIYDTTLQLYLVKFANLSFSMWAVTKDGLKKALQHPEGKNQAPIVYRVKEYGLPKFEKMTIKELKNL
jgi:hypothetical protein